MTNRLLESIQAACAFADDDDVFAGSAPAVSAWSVGQQLDHIAKVHAACMIAIRRLARNPAATPKGKPRFFGRLMLWAGRIPRGKGPAPKFTRPADQPEPDAVRAALARCEETTRDLPPLPARGGTTLHPVLGDFTAKQWLRFAAIHIDHHLRIIRDIVAAR